jgi:integrase
VLPTLGDVRVEELTTERLRHWLNTLAATPPRVRTPKGEAPLHAKAGKSEDAKRKRQVSANRVLINLRAALNLAFREGKVSSDTAWRRVRPFAGVDVARVRYLTIAEAQRLINASEAPFRQLVQAALQTGARHGELIKLQVQDFNPDAGTLGIRTSKKSRLRHIVLTEEGQKFFRQLCAGRVGSDPMLDWRWTHTGNLTRPMREACERARIKPPISFHVLRHTWASLAVMAHMPLMVVAKNMGHRDTRMVELHYGHLADDYITEAIRASAPRFGVEIDQTVTPLRR